MQRPNQKKFRGISGVVIAVLLTVIGIAAVLMFWGMMSGFFNPQPKVIIEKATITKTGQNTYDISITVRETGGASTEILYAVITGGELPNEVRLDFPTTNQQQGSQQQGSQQQAITLSPGQSKTLVFKLGDGQQQGSQQQGQSVTLRPGVTYYVAVYYKKGDGIERSDLYPVTVR
jgi:hypothetical protein